MLKHIVHWIDRVLDRRCWTYKGNPLDDWTYRSVAEKCTKNHVILYQHQPFNREPGIKEVWL